MFTRASLATFALAITTFSSSAVAQEQFTVNTAVKVLHLSDIRGSKLTGPAGAKLSDADLVKNTKALSTDEEPFKSGLVKYADAEATIERLIAKFDQEDGGTATPPSSTTAPAPKGAVPARPAPTERVTFIHLLRWAQADHSSVEFQRWYVHDPYDTQHSFDFTTDQQRFEGTYVTGRTSFRLIYVHLNYDLLAEGQESIVRDDRGFDVLKAPVSYKVTIQKQKTQLARDFQTVLSVLGFTGTEPAALEQASADPVVGYFSVFTFESAFQTSQVAITASLKQEKKQPTGTAPAAVETTANDLANRTFRNERRAWLGLSAAIPLASYDDIEYDQTGGAFVPKSIKRENVYFVADFYIPSVKPGLTRFRWLPHPFFGLPITGQPLHHSMAGLGVGLRWLEPFWAAVFNVEDTLDASGKRTDRRTVIKGVWGIKVSVDAVAAALGKTGGGGSAAGTATKTDAKKEAGKKS